MAFEHVGSMATEKAKILLVGSGGVGTMAAYALESGGRAAVTAVLRSNYDAVESRGFDIDSIEHGNGITGFRPSHIMKSVPNISDGKNGFEFIVVTTKNVPDIKPTVVDILESAVTPGHSAVVLLQNGLNIERPLIDRFPGNVILSGVSMIGATEYEKGRIRHDDKDILKLGAFDSPQVPRDVAVAAAERFVELYSACGKVDCTYDDDVHATRWRKLVYNSCYNSIATILQMDTCRMRIYEHVIDNLVRPCMLEIRAVAAAVGVEITLEYVEQIINVDPTDTYFKPSMQQDIEKWNYIEFENIVGEPLREANRLGVPVPTLFVVYGILKGLQAKVMEERGLIEPKFAGTSKYRK